MVDEPTKDTIPTIPFKLRLDMFILCESWCGFGLRFEHARQLEINSVKQKLDGTVDQRERSKLANEIDEKRKLLSLVALKGFSMITKAMAALLKGPITDKLEPGLTLDTNSLLSWINAILASPNSAYHDVIRPAIVSLLTYNTANERLFEDIIRQCYSSERASEPKIPHHYFMAIVECVSQHVLLNKYITKILCLALCQIGHESKSIRRGAANLILSIDRFPYLLI
jgi:hypothetical protein